MKLGSRVDIGVHVNECGGGEQMLPRALPDETADAHWKSSLKSDTFPGICLALLLQKPRVGKQ